MTFLQEICTLSFNYQTAKNMKSVVLVSIYQKKNNKYIFCKKKKKTIQMTLKTKDKCLLKIDDNSLPEFSKKSSMEPVL